MLRTKIALKVVVTLAIAVRIIAFTLNPKTFSRFAPDEATYSALAMWISADKPAQLFPAYGEKLYLTSRFFLFPSNVMIRLGIDPLQAIRLTSLLFGCASLVLFAHISLMRQEEKRLGVNTSWPIIVINLIFCFLPSHLLWSAVGLRETTIEFLLLVVVWALLKIHFLNYQNFSMYLVMMFLSLICMNATRPQVSYVVIASLLLYFLHYSIRNRRAILLTLITALSLISVNSVAWDSPLENKSTQWYWVTDSEDPTNAASCSNVYQIVKGGNGTFTCDISRSRPKNDMAVSLPSNEEIINNSKDFAIKMYDSNIKERVSLITTIRQAENIQENNRQDANTPFPKISCENLWFFGYSVNSNACTLVGMSLNSLNFLFRPLPLIDKSTTFANYASQIENIFWIILVSLALRRLYLGRRFLLQQSELFMWLFLLLYTAGSSMTEGNFGTAFRHKSILLSVLLLITFRAVETKKSDELNIKSPTI
jgi:hypothetical protein